MITYPDTGVPPGERPKILIVLHQESSSPGRAGQMLQQRGFFLDIRRPRFGDALPASLDGYRGAIVFGGPMSANDPDPGIVRETDWLKVPLREGAPFLGICLGAQMLARHLGARVGPHEDGVAEIGYYPLRPTEAGRALMPWPGRVYQWHREGFELPAGAELLAEGDTFRNQAYRYGETAFGIQFHAELTFAMMNRWTVLGGARMAMPGAQARRDHFAGRAIYDQAVRRWLDGFLDLWLASDRRERPVAAAAGR